MGKYSIGEFEEIVMLTVAILYSNAYGISIKENIEHKIMKIIIIDLKMYKFCLLFAAVSAVNMLDQSKAPQCLKAAGEDLCHFEGTKNICACPSGDNSQITVGKCV